MKKYQIAECKRQISNLQFPWRQAAGLTELKRQNPHCVTSAVQSLLSGAGTGENDGIKSNLNASAYIIWFKLSSEDNNFTIAWKFTNKTLGIENFPR